MKTKETCYHLIYSGISQRAYNFGQSELIYKCVRLIFNQINRLLMAICIIQTSMQIDTYLHMLVLVSMLRWYHSMKNLRFLSHFVLYVGLRGSGFHFNQ